MGFLFHFFFPVRVCACACACACVCVYTCTSKCVSTFVCSQLFGKQISYTSIETIFQILPILHTCRTWDSIDFDGELLYLISLCGDLVDTKGCENVSVCGNSTRNDRFVLGVPSKCSMVYREANKDLQFSFNYSQQSPYVEGTVDVRLICGKTLVRKVPHCNLIIRQACSLWIDSTMYHVLLVQHKTVSIVS